jgi:PKD repeat protein
MRDEETYSLYDVACASIIPMCCVIVSACIFALLISAVSADTLIVYPSANGQIGKDYNLDYTTLRNGPGTYASTGGTVAFTYLESSGTTNKYVEMDVQEYIFNTSSIPDTVTVDSAIFGGNLLLFAHTLGEPDMGITGITPTTPGTVAATDYQSRLNFPRYATDMPFADLEQDNWYNYTLNSAGLANISKTGFTNISVRFSWDIDNITPSWSASKSVNYKFYTSESSVLKTYLAVEYTLPDTTPPASITNLANVTTCNSINWTWTNPTDGDFNHTVIYQNNTFLHNVTNTTTFDLWESLAELTEYIFSSKTCDLTGNCNTTFVNQTVNTTVCGSAPIADFTSNQTVICINETIQFNDTSINIPDAWHWILTGGWDSHDQNPTHTFDALGQYTVNLTASNAYGNDTESKIDYINVLDCSIIACNITLTPTLITTSFIKWEWDSGNNITYASIDGKNISSFDINSSTFIISDLIPDTRHMFKIYNETDCGVNTTYTLPEIIIQTEQEQFFGVINLYILFVIALICIGIAAFVPIVGLGASAFALIGLLSSVNNSFVMGFLFFIVLCAGIIACMADFGG